VVYVWSHSRNPYNKLQQLQCKKLSGHNDFETTMVYTHVLSFGGGAQPARSAAEACFRRDPKD